ncbi:hypothetical protein [Tahibacter soli]|uniref:Uncharacterized protein n=1 Tax=Tahibacter soli TaxID=2983605 RepID=A0A9X3YJH2_9GAMM|nr:hypothetical protein [Tahibacter soli]MDC8012275.1 hypothetical protein [Tahibacter soli]
MTTLESEAARSKQQLLDAIDKRDSIKSELQKSEAELQENGYSNALMAKIGELRSQLGDQVSVVEARGAEWREAAANLSAEQKLENEMHKELNKDNDPELGRAPGKSLDDFGKKKDDLER